MPVSFRKSQFYTILLFIFINIYLISLTDLKGFKKRFFSFLTLFGLVIAFSWFSRVNFISFGRLSANNCGTPSWPLLFVCMLLVFITLLVLLLLLRPLLLWPLPHIMTYHGLFGTIFNTHFYLWTCRLVALFPTDIAGFFFGTAMWQRPPVEFRATGARANCIFDPLFAARLWNTRSIAVAILRLHTRPHAKHTHTHTRDAIALHGYKPHRPTHPTQHTHAHNHILTHTQALTHSHWQERIDGHVSCAVVSQI